MDDPALVGVVHGAGQRLGEGGGRARRLRGAAQEIQNYHQYDYVLVNEEVQSSVATLVSIVMAERVRRIRVEDKIQPILESFEIGEVA